MPDYSEDPGAQVALQRLASDLERRESGLRHDAAKLLAQADEVADVRRTVMAERRRYPNPLMGPGSPDGGK